MKDKTKRTIIITIFIIIFGCMYILNSKTLLVSDDYPYQFVFTGRFPNNDTQLITNPLQIFISMKNHWFLWGGRVTVNYFLQLIFMLGVPFFNIFNSLMFILLGWLIYKHINNTKNIKISLLIFIYSMIFLFIPQPGSTIMWKSGSANYLWASVFILLMTLIYKKHYGIILDDYINKRYRYTIKTEYLDDEIKVISSCLIETINDFEKILIEEKKNNSQGRRSRLF